MTDPKRGPGQPKIGKGCVRVTMTLEREMLEALDARAAAEGIKRSALIRKVLQRILRRRIYYSSSQNGGAKGEY